MFTKIGGFASILRILNFGCAVYQSFTKKEGVAGAQPCAHSVLSLNGEFVNGEWLVASDFCGGWIHRILAKACRIVTVICANHFVIMRVVIFRLPE